MLRPINFYSFERMGLAFVFAVVLAQGSAQDVTQGCTGIGRTILLNRFTLLGDLQCLDGQGDTARCLVDIGDTSVDLVAYSKALRTLFRTIAGQVGLADEGFHSRVVAEGDFDAAGRDFRNRTGDGVVAVDARAVHRVASKLLDAQGDTLFLDVDVEDFRVNHVALLEGFHGFFAGLVPGDVGQVNHAVDFAFQANKQTEFGDVLDLALDGGAGRVVLCEHFPRIALGLLDAQGDAALFGVDIENHDLNFLGSGQDLARMDVFLGPGHFGNVDQAFNALFQLNECTVLRDVGDTTFEGCANRVFRSNAIPRVRHQLFHAEGDTLGVLVDLDDLDGNRLTNFDNFGRVAEGEAREGVVKNITDYGAFVDLGGVDGLLHVTDMAWRRVNHPSEILSIGETVKVQVIKINKETHRISLGMKQLQEDPWDLVGAKYPLSSVHKGRVTNITDYGAFVELEPGVEGLVHVSEMSWTKKNVHPGKIVSTSQEVDVMVLEIDGAKRRVSLGLKQTMRNPWEVFAETHPEGTQVEGEVKNITEFGLFIGLDGDIDGMVHLSDLSWDERGEDAIQNYRKGDMVSAVVSEVDVEKERISLSIKALGGDKFAEAVGGVKRGSVITVEVTAIEDGGIEVEYEGMKSFIRRSDLSRDRAEQRPERFSVGDKVDVRVTNVDSKTRRLGLSIKAREIAEEKEAVEQYGSSDSGASLGDILGAALKSGD